MVLAHGRSLIGLSPKAQSSLHQDRFTSSILLKNKTAYWLKTRSKTYVLLMISMTSVLCPSRTSAVRKDWWRMTGSNRRPPACKAGALPAELIPLWLVGLDGFEPSTPALSRRCSNQLSYRPLTGVRAASLSQHTSADQTPACRLTGT